MNIKFSKHVSKITKSLLGDVVTSKLKYYHQRRRWPNYNNPKDLSEYILSERFKISFDKYAQYADKILVREYVKSKGLGHLLLQHYGVWDKPEDINFELLPNRFILKANNGCGNHYICRNKQNLNIQLAIEILNKSIKAGQNSPERHYRAIKPKVFCEELLDLGSDELPTDYKIQCLNGKPDHFFIASEREKKAKYCTLDFDWNILDYTKKIFIPTRIPDPPIHMKEMVEYARILSQDFPCVRVDFYEYKGHVYFSELTFSPWGGFLYSYTNESIKMLGRKLGL